MYVFYVRLQPVGNADFVIPVEIDGTIHQVTASLSSLYHSCIVSGICGWIQMMLLIIEA